jgi:hypothetical protein
MAEQTVSVQKNTLIGYLHGQVDRFQSVCSVSSSVHNNCDKRAQLLYMCVSVCVLVARKAWLRMQKRRAGVVMIHAVGLQVVWGILTCLGKYVLGAGRVCAGAGLGGGITDSQHSRVDVSCRCLES